ncbi:hypothetical protein, partial [Sulfitobacter sp. HI0023]
MAQSNIAFLNELLHSVGSRMRQNRFAKPSREKAAVQIGKSCADLLRRTGEASQIAVAEQALAA